MSCYDRPNSSYLRKLSAQELDVELIEIQKWLDMATGMLDSSIITISTYESGQHQNDSWYRYEYDKALGHLDSDNKNWCQANSRKNTALKIVSEREKQYEWGKRRFK